MRPSARLTAARTAPIGLNGLDHIMAFGLGFPFSFRARPGAAGPARNSSGQPGLKRCSDLFGAAGKKQLAALQLSEIDRIQTDRSLAFIDDIGSKNSMSASRPRAPTGPKSRWRADC